MKNYRRWHAFNWKALLLNYEFRYDLCSFRTISNDQIQTHFTEWWLKTDRSTNQIWFNTGWTIIIRNDQDQYLFVHCAVKPTHRTVDSVILNNDGRSAHTTDSDWHSILIWPLPLHLYKLNEYNKHTTDIHFLSKQLVNINQTYDFFFHVKRGKPISLCKTMLEKGGYWF